MKKEPNANGEYKPILFHVPPYENFSQLALYSLLAFSTRDQKIANIVKGMIQDKTVMLPSDNALIRNILSIANENPDKLELVYFCNDLGAINDALVKNLTRFSCENLCYHVIITSKSISDLTVGNTRKPNPLAVSKEIRESICNCMTFFLSSYMEASREIVNDEANAIPSDSPVLQLSDPPAEVLNQYINKNESIIDGATKILRRYQQNPSSVDAKELLAYQSSLERQVNDAESLDPETRSNCIYALIKLHYVLAKLTRDFETTKYHLFKAARYLKDSSLGSDKPLLDRKTAVLYHMLGKVLIEKGKDTELALLYLRQAYQIYKTYEMIEPMQDIMRLSPDILLDRSESSGFVMK